MAKPKIFARLNLTSSSLARFHRYIWVLNNVGSLVVFTCAILLPSTYSISNGKAFGEHWAIDLEKASRIDQLIVESDGQDFVGAVLGIVRRGELEYCKAYGHTNPQHNKPLSKDSVFYIASCSKQFTAAAFALLHLEGKASLDANVQDWLPNATHSESGVQFHNLIHHTSGIDDYGLLRFFQGHTFNEHFTNEDVIKVVTRDSARRFPPSQQFSYCNSNYVLLASAVERISKSTFAEFTQRRLFEPLDMRQTYWKPRNDELQLASYVPTDNGLETHRIEFDTFGDGNLWSSVPDLAKWDRVFYPNSPLPGLSEIMLRQGTLSDGTTLPYAFGLVRSNLGKHTAWSHSGEMFGYQSSILRVPKEHLCVIVLANSPAVDTGQVSRAVVDIVLGTTSAEAIQPRGNKPSKSNSVERPTEEQAVANDLSTLAGTYYSRELDTTWNIEHNGRELSVTLCNHRLSFTAKATDQFQTQAFAVRFTRDRSGRSKAFSVHSETTSPVHFKRTK